MTYYTLDDNNKGVPTVDMNFWGQWMQENRARTQVDDQVINGSRVSTIFMGIDHNWEREGDPILFETMIFGLDEQAMDCQRYETWDQALEGHKLMVEQVSVQAKEEVKEAEAVRKWLIEPPHKLRAIRRRHR